MSHESEIEKAFKENIVYLCEWWRLHKYTDVFILGAMCLADKHINKELYFLHQISLLRDKL